MTSSASVSFARRAIVAAATLALIAAPAPAALAKPPAKIFRVGFLAQRISSDSAPLLDAFRQELRELGWVEGKNIVLEPRWDEGRFERLPALAAELVSLKCDVILVSTTAPALAAKNATRTIPIVMAMSGDPVALGLVSSLARPGGNVMGLSYSVGLETMGKQLEFLKAAVPELRRLAVLLNPTHPSRALAMDQVTRAAQPVGVQLQLLDAPDLKEIESAFTAMAKEHAQALLVMPDPFFVFHRARIHEHTVKARLPAVYGLKAHTEAGGLMSYAPDLTDNFRRAAGYVDKILKGAKPADLPVEQPTKFELVINLKTAKALGLTLPQSLLLRADRVIE